MATGNVLDVLRIWNHAEVEHVLQLASLRRWTNIIHGDLLTTYLHDLFPVAPAHARICTLLKKRKSFKKLVDCLFELSVSVPLSKGLWHTFARILKASGSL